MLRKTRFPTFDAVQAGKWAMTEFDAGRKYHLHTLIVGDDGTASTPLAGETFVSGGVLLPGIAELIAGRLVQDMKLTVGSHEQRVFNPMQLNRINTLQAQDGSLSFKTSGTPGTANFRVYMPIALAEVYRDNPLERGLLAWNCDGISDFQLQVELADGLNGIYLDGITEWEPADKGKGLGPILKWIRSEKTISGSLKTLKLDTQDFIGGIHFFPTDEDAPKYVEYLTVKANGAPVHDRLSTLENQAILLGRRMNPDMSAAPIYHYVPDYDDPTANGLPAGQLASLEAKVEMNDAADGNMTIIYERAGMPE